jgi:hypothetical protein
MTIRKSDRSTLAYPANRERISMKSSLCTCLLRKSTWLCSGFAGFPLLTFGLLAVIGCASGNTTSKVAVGPMAFTDANGTPQQQQLTALAAGESTYLTVNLADDPQQLGANWSVYCGSALPPGSPLPPGLTQDESCGTFTPVHTMSGPIPGYVTSGAGYVTLYAAPTAPPKGGVVTLYASATSNPSKWESVTLTINALPIAVQFVPALPTTLHAGSTAQFKAVVSNDSTNAGVSWTVACTSSDCGSFSAAKTASGVVTTYTAPATVPTGGTVTITAASVADSTKSMSSVISIM